MPDGHSIRSKSTCAASPRPKWATEGLVAVAGGDDPHLAHDLPADGGGGEDPCPDGQPVGGDALGLHLEPMIPIAVAHEEFVLAAHCRVTHEEIEVSVFVKIDPSATLVEAAAFARHGAGIDRGEVSVSLIPPQPKGGIAFANDQIQVTVVVEVSPGVVRTSLIGVTIRRARAGRPMA